MSSVKVNITDRIPEFNADIKMRLRNELRRTGRISSLYLERSIVQKIDSMNKVDRGDLRKSITHAVKTLPNGVRCNIGTNLEYAIYVHEGTKPHYPPVQPIREWVRRKLKPAKEDLNRITYMVIQKIGKKGTDPNPFLKEVFDEKEMKVRTEFAKAIARVARSV